MTDKHHERTDPAEEERIRAAFAAGIQQLVAQQPARAATPSGRRAVRWAPVLAAVAAAAVIGSVALVAVQRSGPHSVTASTTPVVTPPSSVPSAGALTTRPSISQAPLPAPASTRPTVISGRTSTTFPLTLALPSLSQEPEANISFIPNRVTLDGDAARRCVWFTSNGVVYNTYWPRGYTARFPDARTIEVLDASGKVVLTNAKEQYLSVFLYRNGGLSSSVPGCATTTTAQAWVFDHRQNG